MFAFSWKLKSAPFLLFFSVVFALSLVSCDRDLDVGPPQGVGNQGLAASNAGGIGKGVKPGDATLVEIAVDSGFNELVTAVVYVDSLLSPEPGLVELFSDTSAYTIFAPTDSAFFAFYDSLGVGGISDIDPETVYDVLLYHVTNGRRIAASVVPRAKFKTIQTLLNEKFVVDVNADIEANSSTASIIAADISASNGIIHVIDGVLQP